MNVIFVRQLSPAKKLEMYKKIKGWCLFENCRLTTIMHSVLNEKVKDVENILDYDMNVNYMEVYKDYSYGRY